jgi:hypothetical protein
MTAFDYAAIAALILLIVGGGSAISGKQAVLIRIKRHRDRPPRPFKAGMWLFQLRLPSLPTPHHSLLSTSKRLRQRLGKSNARQAA